MSIDTQFDYFARLKTNQLDITQGLVPMSNQRKRKPCHWCGREYTGSGNYGCCGEKCYREWIAANPHGKRNYWIAKLIVYATVGAFIYWSLRYNSIRPHASLGGNTPNEIHEQRTTAPLLMAS